MTTTELRQVDDATPPDTGRRRRRLVLIVAGVVILAVFVTWLVAFSSAFGVRNVDVKGTRSLSKAQIVDAAAVDKGTPLVRLDTAAVTERVEKLADVESAQVTTSFPSTVVITVDERTPVGYVTAMGTTALIDHTGRRYRTVSDPPAGLPQLVVPSGTGTGSTVAAVADVASSLPSTLRARVSSIQALDPDSISVVLRDVKGDKTSGQTVVRWGSDDRNSDKARVVAALSKRDAEQIDVTDPDQPFTRPS